MRRCEPRARTAAPTMLDGHPCSLVRLPPMRVPALAALVLTALLACKALNKKEEAPAAASAAASAAVAPAASAAPGSVPPPGTKTHPPSPDKPLEWAAGQWTRHRTRMGGSDASLTYKIVEQRGDDYRLEVVSEHPTQGKTVLQIELTLKSVREAHNSTIKAAKVKLPNGAVQEFKGALLKTMQGMYKHFLGFLSLPDFARMPREDVTVQAGHFPRCYRNDEPANIPNVPKTGPSWVHFSVPISGVVRVAGVDGSTQMELLEFGVSGAASEL